MAEEKKIGNAEEILSEEQLDDVAGGTSWEVCTDADNLRRIGRFSGYASANRVNDALWQLGQDIGLNIGCEQNDNGKSNRYYINNHKVSRRELWDKISDRMGRSRQYFD